MGSNVSGNSLTINLNSLRQLVSYNISEKSPKPDLTTIIEYPRQLSSTLLNNHICIYKALCLSVYPLRFVLPLGDKHFPNTVGRGGKHFSHTGVGQTFWHTRGTNISTQWGETFYTRGVTNILCWWWWQQWWCWWQGGGCERSEQALRRS